MLQKIKLIEEILPNRPYAVCLRSHLGSRFIMAEFHFHPVEEPYLVMDTVRHTMTGALSAITALDITSTDEHQIVVTRDGNGKWQTPYNDLDIIQVPKAGWHEIMLRQANTALETLKARGITKDNGGLVWQDAELYLLHLEEYPLGTDPSYL